MKLRPYERDGKVVGYRFLCPGCAEYDEPGSRLYATHAIDTSWSYNGYAAKPTVGPSILVTNGRPEYRCHSFIEGGRIRFLSDCSHALAAQTVELPEFE